MTDLATRTERTLKLLSLRMRGSRIATEFRIAVLSMRIRHWLRKPYEPRQIRLDHFATRREPGVAPDDWDIWRRPEDDDGPAGSRVPRRPLLDPGSASATAGFEYDDRSSGQFGMSPIATSGGGAATTRCSPQLVSSMAIHSDGR
jgi:hypothetical protein